MATLPNVYYARLHNPIERLVAFDSMLQPFHSVVKGAVRLPQSLRRLRDAAGGPHQFLIDGQLLPLEVLVDRLAYTQLAGIPDYVLALLYVGVCGSAFRRDLLSCPDLASRLVGRDHARAL